MALRCCVPGCSSGDRTFKPSQIQLVRAPKDPALLKRWKEVMPPREKEFTSKSFICIRHFDESQLMRNEELLIHGKVIQLSRFKYKLKPQAVPSIFPLPNKYQSQNHSKERTKEKNDFSVSNVSTSKSGAAKLSSSTSSSNTSRLTPLEEIILQSPDLLAKYTFQGTHEL